MLDLRPVAPGDAPALHALLCDPDVARWLRPKNLTGPFSFQECETWVARDAAHWDAHGFGPWLAWGEDGCAGRCLLKHSVVEGRGEIEIGWGGGTPHRGGGGGGGEGGRLCGPLPTQTLGGRRSRRDRNRLGRGQPLLGARRGHGDGPPRPGGGRAARDRQPRRLHAHRQRRLTAGHGKA